MNRLRNAALARQHWAGIANMAFRIPPLLRYAC